MTDATADESVEEEINAGEDEGEESPGESGGKKRLIIIAAAATVLLLGGAGAGAYFGGFLDPFLGGGAEHAADTAEEVAYFDLPEMVVNLEAGSKQSFLKIQLSLELDATQDTTALTRVLPRVIDQFQVFLRELRADDLQGSAGIYRVKEELLRRVSVAAHPIEIRDVLFKEMLIQ